MLIFIRMRRNRNCQRSKCRNKSNENEKFFLVTIAIITIIITIIIISVIEIHGNTFTSLIVGGIVGVGLSSVGGAKLWRMPFFATFSALPYFATIRTQVVCLVMMFAWSKFPCG